MHLPIANRGHKVCVDAVKRGESLDRRGELVKGDSQYIKEGIYINSRLNYHYIECAFQIWASILPVA